MSTAQQLIEGALKLLAVKRPGIAATAVQLADGLETLNDLLVELQARNIKIPMSLVADVTSEVGNDDWTNAFLKTELALRLAPEYSLQPSPGLMKMWRDAKRTVYAHIVDLRDVSKSDILPIGSGNQDISWNNREFYTDVQRDAIETDSASILEDNESGFITQTDNQGTILGG